MPAEQPQVVVERWSEGHTRWPDLAALDGVEDLHLEAKRAEWHLGIYTLVALDDANRNRPIAGVLRFWTQVIGVDEDRPPLVVDGADAIEAKVVTLHVLDDYRRRGTGRLLQLEAARWAAELGAYQVRSRSRYAAAGNHALKGSLGFGVSPGRDRPDGSGDPTAFFVLPLQLDPELAAVIGASRA